MSQPRPAPSGITLDAPHRRTGCERGRTPWSPGEESELRKLLAAGWPVARIARHHGRSRGAIRARMERLQRRALPPSHDPSPLADRSRGGRDAILLALARMEAHLADLRADLRRALGPR